jgi:microcystin-dependent protein
MSEPFIGEIRMVGFAYAPEHWANADGQLLPIDQHAALFSLYSTTYGGDGRNNFALPDFRGRVPIHTGRGTGLLDYYMGQAGGAPSVTLQENQAPIHTHPASVHAKAATADQTAPTDHFWAETGRNIFAADQDSTMNADAVQVQANTSGGQPHENMQPFLTIRFCVSLDGLYPPRP